MGKTALLAQLVTSRGYLHHFNIAVESRNKPDQFVKNICARIIVNYKLPYTTLPAEVEKNPTGAILSLLGQASKKLGHGERLVIAVDALDEVEWPTAATTNVLHLPVSLPDRVYLIVTRRPLDPRDHRNQLQVSPCYTLTLDKDAAWNRTDARKYINSHLEEGHKEQQGIKAWIQARQLTEPEFLELLLEKSEGNFMYLRHVLPALGRNKGCGYISAEIKPDELPKGLTRYYETHWKQMQIDDPELFDQLYRPVICTLAAAEVPVSAGLVAKWKKLALHQVQRVLGVWREFLQEEPGPDDQRLYSIYHRSFKEFLVEVVGLIDAHTEIAEAGLQLFGISPSLQ